MVVNKMKATEIRSLSVEELEKKLAELDAVLVSARKDAGSMDAYLKKVGESLPEGMTLDGDKIQWTEPLDNRNLECVVQVLPLEEKERTRWISHKLIVDEPEEDWEW